MPSTGLERRYERHTCENYYYIYHRLEEVWRWKAGERGVRTYVRRQFLPLVSVGTATDTLWCLQRVTTELTLVGVIGKDK